jgi:hypothetical protein
VESDPGGDSMTKKLKGIGGQSQPLVVIADTMTDLWSGLNDALIWATEDELVYFSSLDTMIGDGLGVANSAAMEMNIGRELWVTPSRWTTLIRQYVDPERLFQWLDSIRNISTYKRGIAAMDMNVVKPTVVASNARANRRKHGGCMRMITYRAFPQPTVSLYSRTSYLGYIGGLDMLLAHKLIEMAADMIGEGLKPEDFAFRWHCDVYQFHGFKSLSYIFASGQDPFIRVPEEQWPVGKRFRGRIIGPLESYPTWKLVRYWWNRINSQDDVDGPKFKLYQDMKYSAEKRIRRRYHAQTGIDQTPYLGDQEKEYKPLNIPKSLIGLDQMLYKSPESRAIIRKQKEQRKQQLLSNVFADDSWLEAI